ncbi:unnamed protein product, partial [Gongylonema pulchrum]|uniref:G protein-coupled receptor n=1 Tax=Gongylonema pulchrum TaxID=637853 RepID=A0A183DJ86_9BILA
MLESSTSKGTANSPSFHIEQVVTNQVVLMQARTLLTLTLVALGAALQLVCFCIRTKALRLHKDAKTHHLIANSSDELQMIFAIICVFYDGCPYYLAVISSILFMFNAATVLCFIRYKPTRTFL